ncbi:MAG: aminotransferase class I/II-fold pyridoxal phosphate-dependent enzyme [Ottowia sp.]|nr:aminotransferase class I/II-fold pyridoxal phosphate-dependent enzyme [Ottowia sp.]
MNTGSDEHGGTDAQGAARHDLSTNANACGPWLPALRAVQAADARRYPDPAYTALTRQLAAWHGVAPARIVLGAGASELISRLSAAAALEGARSFWTPAHAYGDYARAAHAAGLLRADTPEGAALLWACEPSSPLGQAQGDLPQLAALAAQGARTLVLDCAYAPLRLDGRSSLPPAALDGVWQLITPNKALALTGVRAAYAIAPLDAGALLARVRALTPSWVVGAHGVAMLQCWATPEAHRWLAACRVRLRLWRARQQRLLRAAGWEVLPTQTNFFCARPPDALLTQRPPPPNPLPLCAADAARGARGCFFVPALLAALRAQGFKLRDCASFGLPGHVRIAVAHPRVQDALMAAIRMSMYSSPA